MPRSKLHPFNWVPSPASGPTASKKKKKKGEKEKEAAAEPAAAAVASASASPKPAAPKPEVRRSLAAPSPISKALEEEGEEDAPLLKWTPALLTMEGQLDAFDLVKGRGQPSAGKGKGKGKRKGKRQGQKLRRNNGYCNPRQWERMIGRATAVSSGRAVVCLHVTFAPCLFRTRISPPPFTTAP